MIEGIKVDCSHCISTPGKEPCKKCGGKGCDECDDVGHHDEECTVCRGEEEITTGV